MQIGLRQEKSSHRILSLEECFLGMVLDWMLGLFRPGQLVQKLRETALQALQASSVRQREEHAVLLRPYHI